MVIQIETKTMIPDKEAEKYKEEFSEELTCFRYELRS